MTLGGPPARSKRWPPCPERPVLRRGEVQVWLMQVPSSRQEIKAIAAGLPAVELRRARRFLRADARARYLTGRAALRTTLGRLLDVPGARLRFDRGHGPGDRKPRLLEPAGDDIDFNLAHSGALVVVAVALRLRVGVDVERPRPSLDVAGVARRALSPVEVAELEALPNQDERHAAFLRCWTRKEAYLKARGSGLPGELRSWSVATSKAAIVAPRVPGDPRQSVRWRIRSLPLDGGYAGAVAHDGAADLLCVSVESQAHARA